MVLSTNAWVFLKIYNENDPLQVGGPNYAEPKEDKKEKSIDIDEPYENCKPLKEKFPWQQYYKE